MHYERGSHILALVNDELLASYRSTRYCVWEGGRVERCLKIGERSSWLDDLLSERGLDSAVFITAQNPGSRVLDEKENRQRTEVLRDNLVTSGYEFLSGYGKGVDPNWSPEQSFLVLGMSLEQGELLATRFGQFAFVYARAFHERELIIAADIATKKNRNGSTD
jgi:hypothetical protein